MLTIMKCFMILRARALRAGGELLTAQAASSCFERRRLLK